MKNFYRHMSIRVDIEAKDEKEAEQICQDMNVDVTYKISGKDAISGNDRVLHCEIVDWDDLIEDKE